MNPLYARFWIALLALVSMNAEARIEPNAQPFSVPVASPQAIEMDLEIILAAAHLPSGSVRLVREPSKLQQKAVEAVEVRCEADHIAVAVNASDAEWAPAFYYALHKLGFLFPHPRTQISPSLEQLQQSCGKSFVFQPRFERRGFHLNTLFPNEWMRGFIEGQTAIAEESVRWLARNFQNTLEIALVKKDIEALGETLRAPFELARALGVLTGVSVTLETALERRFRLIQVSLPFTRGFQIRNTADSLADEIAFDYLALDLARDEWNPKLRESTEEWIEVLRQKLSERSRGLFVRNHPASEQLDGKYGNADVGVQARTAFFYSLEDLWAPAFGRKNFESTRKMLFKETEFRPTWYVPQTSSFLASDVDVPLLLTDFLRARSTDMSLIEKNGVKGHLALSAGQELGYWLVDWTVALLSSGDYRDRPGIGLELLGENPDVWSQITQFQSLFYKQERLFSVISGSTIFDEFPWCAQPLHERTPLKKLRKNRALIEDELSRLGLAIEKRPLTDGVRNPELRALVEIGFLRLEHAVHTRKALLYSKGSVVRLAELQGAAMVRARAQNLMKFLMSDFDRYPEARNFESSYNSTSYSFGYLWPAATLHYWLRDEEMIRASCYRSGFMNIYNIWELL